MIDPSQGQHPAIDRSASQPLSQPDTAGRPPGPDDTLGGATVAHPGSGPAVLPAGERARSEADASRARGDDGTQPPPATEGMPHTAVLPGVAATAHPENDPMGGVAR